MTFRPSPRGAFFLGLLLVASLPFLSRALAAPRGDRCSFDGIRLDASRAVRVVLATGSSLAFCGVRCAVRWLDAKGSEPKEVFVTDEVTGREIPAAGAVFVRSLVVSVPATGDHVHVFADRAEALRHADAYRGVILEGSERPFGTGGRAR